MKNLRRWQLDATQPLSLQVAADARLSSTDYADDQIWELTLGQGDSAALAFQTQYGGRVGLASLVPMWGHDGRTIYQAHTYATPPTVTAFAPGYLQIQANITANIKLQAEYWAMESHAVGGCFTLGNTSGQAEALRLDIFGHVIAQNQEQALAIIAQRGGGNALAMGEIGNLRPVVLVENGSASTLDDSVVSPKIGVDLSLAPKKSVTVRWVHAGRTDWRDSLALAKGWLEQDWTPHFTRIAQAAQAIPQIATGKKDWDATIAFSYQQLVQAFMKPTASLPNASFVSTRQTWQGFSRRGDGSDHPRAWSGQNPATAYLVGSAMAAIAPQMAQGIMRNYLATQAADGWVDYQPGLGAQRQQMLCLPILARLTWNIYQATQDTTFLEDVFPPLLAFFERWFGDDLDADGDGIPEWQSERQTGYVFVPTFSVGSSWGQNADIRTVETPDLIAYLLSEAASLREMAQLLDKKRPISQLEKRMDVLQTALDSMWFDGRYAYRDRDSHVTASGQMIIEKGRADEEQLPALPLNPASRVIVHVIGGTDDAPKLSLYLEGLDSAGKPIKETVPVERFAWWYGQGVYTSQHVYAQLDRVRLDGLSRVFKVTVTTLDSSRLDINGILPIFSCGIPDERAEALVKLITSKSHFWRPNGVTMCSAQDAAFDARNAEGSGGVWPFWLTMIGEGLLDYGYAKEAVILARHLLNAQTSVLRSSHKFFEHYDSDEAAGGSERGHIAGIVPLHLLTRLTGIRIVSSGKVWLDGDFAWEKRIKIVQHGVTVQRTKGGTAITFPSGYKIDLPSGHEAQLIEDPDPVELPMPTPVAPDQPKPAKVKRQPGSVMIDVDFDDAQ